jgi:intracellular sulfur oxidation DsrE/DsrF family protein
MAVDNEQDRRVFLSRIGAGTAAAGLTAMAGQTVHAQAAASAWQPRKHAEDDWLDRVPGVHRFLIDTISPGGFDSALTFAGNYYTANATGYSLTDADLAVVIVARHDSTPFAYTDAVWAKYGASFVQRSGFVDPATHKPPVSNLHKTRLDGLIKRGAHLAVCAMATRRLATVIAGTATADIDTIYKELAANLVANAHLVPAGIVAVNRAQERGYSLANAM